MDYVSEEPVTEPFIERFLYEYAAKQKKRMDQNKTILLIEIEQLIEDEISIIYPNHERIAEKVVFAFKNRKLINVMVVSKTQSGKTGSMCASIKLYLEDPSNLIPIENIYIITGLSSCEWKEQTGERMPKSIRDRVFHRHELPVTFVDDIKSKHNILIIMDEIQVAAKKNQTIYNAFDKALLLNKLFRYEKDIKILEYTATPDGTIYDLMKCKKSSMKILAEAGNGYVSSYDLLQQGRVLQYKDLCGYDMVQYLLDLDTSKKYVNLAQRSKKIYETIKEQVLLDKPYNEVFFSNYMDTRSLHEFKELFVISDLKKLYNDTKKIFKNIQEIKCITEKYNRPLYHIIRTNTGARQELTISNFEYIFGEDSYEFITYDGKSDIEDINKKLLTIPEKHTFIFIKEMLRCAKTLKKNHLGILYERYTSNPNDSSITQGLAGRATGYDIGPNIICFTNIDTIQKYDAMWKSEFESKDIPWISLTTTNGPGGPGSTGTINYIKDDDSVESADIPEINEPIIKRYKTQEEVMDYFNKVIKVRQSGRGPKNIEPIKGFYLATIRGNQKIYSFDEIYNERRQGLTNDTYRLYPCYEDITDPSTLEFWFIHY